MGSPLGPGGNFEFFPFRFWKKINRRRGRKRHATVTSGETILRDQKVQDQRGARPRGARKLVWK